MNASEVDLGGRKLRVVRVGRPRLRAVKFTMNRREYMAIEQNPSKASYWGRLAREGHQVVQFKDVKANRFVAVAVDGHVKEYSSMLRQKGLQS